MMDSELFYVQQKGRAEDTMIGLVARRDDRWYSRIIDRMGVSPVQTYRNRPDMRGFKPYIVCDSWDEVAPLVNAFRTAYVSKLMVECGFESPKVPWESENDFMEAVRTEDGGVAVSASHRPRMESRWVQTIVTVDARTGENKRMTFYDGEESFPWRFKAELERIPAEEAEYAIRSEAEDWWDSKIEQCATWRDARWPGSRTPRRFWTFIARRYWWRNSSTPYRDISVTAIM